MDDGKRRDIPIEEVVFLAAAKQSTSELLKKDSYFLTVLLQLVRQERKLTYNLLRVINKGAALQPGFEEGQREVGKTYQYWTRKAWIIENILRDRVGYYPA
ncbi:hypothetical protein P4H94_23480 [Paenibacillus macerans]|uniref:Uncharacterized protein n=2 Tax=Paenibacillus macerans TaxID=44252 RepID=A0A6N8EMZ6_PAEMA|nr:hypothetical protein [Paenibacillus macerans]MEC0139819.1 hypothetical protein [Paenibacillus macerans]MED4956531.1 hypothetical protein [Paenibacillus macerans]MUG21329.1 hypothetical protein [Paenibacillus macerans]GBK62540.1 hypothetical protein PbDSM24746_25440 [Paenibacillus macerans]GBK68852.1 hypothetical protein PbJCM17693_25600 [Paenibacillus macerans]